MADADVERARWIALRRAGLGSESFGNLIRHFGGIAEAWDAPDGEAKRAGLRTQYVRAFERARRTFDPERETAALAEYDVRTITWEDEEYPDLLKEIPSSPPVLFARGSAGPRFAQALAVVGTRDATPYGRDVCEQLCGAAARASTAGSSATRSASSPRPMPMPPAASDCRRAGSATRCCGLPEGLQRPVLFSGAAPSPSGPRPKTMHCLIPRPKTMHSVSCPDPRLCSVSYPDPRLCIVSHTQTQDYIVRYETTSHTVYS